MTASGNSPSGTPVAVNAPFASTPVNADPIPIEISGAGAFPCSTVTSPETRAPVKPRLRGSPHRHRQLLDPVSYQQTLEVRAQNPRRAHLKDICPVRQIAEEPRPCASVVEK